MSRAIVDGQLYIDGLPFDDWEDYMKLLLDVTELDNEDDNEEY